MRSREWGRALGGAGGAVTEVRRCSRTLGSPAQEPGGCLWAEGPRPRVDQLRPRSSGIPWKESTLNFNRRLPRPQPGAPLLLDSEMRLPWAASVSVAGTRPGAHLRQEVQPAHSTSFTVSWRDAGYAHTTCDFYQHLGNLTIVRLFWRSFLFMKVNPKPRTWSAELSLIPLREFLLFSKVGVCTWMPTCRCVCVRRCVCAHVQVCVRACAGVCAF